MVSGDMLIKLFESFKNQDEKGFAEIAFEIIKEEQKKNHYLLADKLKRAIFSSSNNIKRVPKYINSLGNLPKDKDNNAELLEIKYSEKNEKEIVLTDEIKEKIATIVLEYKKSDVLSTYGLRPKKKLLFCGPPGCGKTLSVEVLSSIINLPILYTRMDSVVSSYLGETASNLAKIFAFAEKGSWVLFFDEFDAIGKSRDNHEDHGELKRVVNTFLQLMDNFKSESIIIAATNYEKLIDNALWRRFDEVIFFDKPGEKEIKRMLELKLKVFKYNFQLDNLVNEMVGLSFADIERICLDSIKKAILEDRKFINIKTFEYVLRKEKERQKLISGFVNFF